MHDALAERTRVHGGLGTVRVVIVLVNLAELVQRADAAAAANHQTKAPPRYA